MGLSDGNPNAIRWDISGGLGGNNPWRLSDGWGVGVFQNSVSRETAIRALKIDDERGAELFYNVGIFPWLHVTLDAQYLDTGLPNANNSFIGGVRAKFDF